MTETTSASGDLISLELCLPGKWHTVDCTESDFGKQQIERISFEILGKADEEALARLQLRRQLEEAVEHGLTGGLRSIHIGQELADGTPFPVSISVYRPDDLRMSPAVTTRSDEVLEILAMGFEDEEEEVSVVRGGNFKALRRVTVEHDERFDDVQPDENDPESQKLNEELKQVELRRLRVEYWCHVPSTKKVALVVFDTNMADIKNTLLELFDTIMLVGLFVDADKAALIDVLCEEPIQEND